MLPLDPLRQKIRDLATFGEETAVRNLLPLAQLTPEQKTRVEITARSWIADIRAKYDQLPSLDRLIHCIRLTDKEGLALMALAEALPRIPDDATADALISDKLSQGDWRSYLQNYPDFMSKLAWFGLTLGKDISTSSKERTWLSDIKAGALREALRAAMKKLGAHFVLGETIEQAVSRSVKKTHALERYSFDMLGEAARTATDAARYFEAYKKAVMAVGCSPGSGNALHGPSISVKLSALHPRYEWAQQERVQLELLPLLTELVENAAQHNIGLTIDAEEAERLELSLSLIEKIMALPALKNYNGFGVAVQAYQKRAPEVINWLYAGAKKHNIKITVRLVKGAYWDKEIKQAQERGLTTYPVYTRKEATDIAYLACARLLFEYRGHIFPQFGTHNLHTVLALREMAGETKDYEVQRLHGMGAELHARIMEEGIASCIYAPVGPHDELLSYLIRRLIENSANNSFINQLYDREVTLDQLLRDPVTEWDYAQPKSHPLIPVPPALYGEERINSAGLDLCQPHVTERIEGILRNRRSSTWQAAPFINGVKNRDDVQRTLKNPANFHHETGQCFDASVDDVARAMKSLHAAQPRWSAVAVNDRAMMLERLANQLEDRRDDLISLLVYEAGKTIPDAVSEVREAIDFCRYYASEARRHFGTPKLCKGINGEDNRLQVGGRGVFVCISPWNFPLAILLGQVAAALVTGNTVAIKPAEQTPLIAAFAATLMLESGFPPSVFALLPGNGNVGAALTSHPLTAGVVFTGSLATAQLINRALAARNGPIAPLIAETGGINALIADSSSLPEQVVDDVIASAFRSAGQRCSAARLLCVQDSIADKVLEMLAGAMDELQVGQPGLLSTDIGPLIDPDAREMLEAHESRLKQEARFIAAAKINEELRFGQFLRPQAWEIPSALWLTREVFGPILHVVRFRTGEMDKLIADINSLGFALTGGIHSRIDPTIEFVKAHLRVGNLYINRSISGAVVGSQPFGGERLSGTGPKAGGPHYLFRFISERSVSTNTMATGGDVNLLTM
jgi:RHH-type proline utilization regulon transcriptional repressor/proline dehydrogenase/delta 1-pyrroline-5-carboxylate dehydrogenase